MQTEIVVPEDTSGGEKTEEATPKKARDARLEGQVAYSQEVMSASLLLVGFATLYMVGPQLFLGIKESLIWVLRDGMVMDLDTVALWYQGWWQFRSMGLWLVVLMGVLFVVAAGMGAMQAGLVFTAKPLVPKWSRINPLSGLKRIFGMRGIMKFIFSLAKLAIIASVAWYIVSAMIFDGLDLKMDLRERFAEKVWVLFILAVLLASTLAIIAVFDYLYQRWQHTKDQRMTKHEVKEEFKQSEGDPLLKAKIRQVQRQMAQSRMMQEVPKADVVITNPTHVAVALRYDQESMRAPVVVAKGYDEVAMRIKAIAREHDIVMVENVPLARALAKGVEVGHPIPGDFYQAVAQVLSHVYKLKGKQLPGSSNSAA
ncbi:MAG: flagellar biosynthesis protein FlhB [Planctomycetota bacterium]|nr:MAG: flagellar biosynthesis protein FlhB [Planctomycetota bacterium]